MAKSVEVMDEVGKRTTHPRPPAARSILRGSERGNENGLMLHMDGPTATPLRGQRYKRRLQFMHLLWHCYFCGIGGFSAPDENDREGEIPSTPHYNTY